MAVAVLAALGFLATAHEQLDHIRNVCKGLGPGMEQKFKEIEKKIQRTETMVDGLEQQYPGLLDKLAPSPRRKGKPTHGPRAE